MGIKKSMWEYGKSILRELIKEPEKADGKKAASLKDLDINELKKAKIRLDLSLDKTLNELRQLEAQKRKYFEETGKALGDREAKVMAQKYLSTDMATKSKDKLFDSLTQQSQLIEGLIQVKEMKIAREEVGIGSVIQSLDLADLSQFVEESTVDGKFDEARFQEMIDVLYGEGPSQNKQQNPAIAAIIESSRKAMRDDPEALDREIKELDNKLSERENLIEDPFADIKE